MSRSFPLGLELLYYMNRDIITTDTDAIVCLVHANLLSRGFKCVGRGEALPNDIALIQPCECLPEYWNENREAYSLLYWSPECRDTYLLKIIKIDSVFLLNMVKFGSNLSTSMSIDLPDHTPTSFASFQKTYERMTGLSNRITSELIMPLEDASTAHQRNYPLREREEHNQARRFNPRYDTVSPPIDLPGRSDVDPIGGGYGGMMFDPFRQENGRFNPELPGIPAGSVPPGARFDPIGPGYGRGRSRGRGSFGPDPDHLPPPGSDDMFM